MAISNSGASVASSVGSGRSSGALSTPFDPFEKDPEKRGQQIRLLQKLYHANHCKEDPHTCTSERHCFAGRKLFTHMSQCTAGSECPVPACRKSRRVWKHYRKCHVSDCWMCSQVPTRYESKHKKVPSFDSTMPGDLLLSVNKDKSPTSVIEESPTGDGISSMDALQSQTIPELPEQRDVARPKKPTGSPPTKPQETRASRMAQLQMRKGLPPRSPMKPFEWAMASSST